MALVKFGVPFDVAFTAPPDWRLAALVVFGEMEGSEWSWREMRWMERKP